MPTFPNRCQHIKVNGTQCGSPALRRNRFCYFHKRHHEERIALNAGRLKAGRSSRRTTLNLPVLEDANSIQVSLMQIMRLLITGQLDGKTAGLLLYALQTASANLRRTTFEPNRHHVILDPAAVDETLLGEYVWDDSDFDDEEEEEEEEEEEDEDENTEEEQEDPEDEDDEEGRTKSGESAVATKRPAARITDDSVVDRNGNEMLKGFPQDVGCQTVKELNQRSG